jgi:argininosuccinate synthase
MKDTTLLAYSGGLDTSVLIKWIQQKYSLIRILTEYKLTLDDVTSELLHKVALDSFGISLNINIEDIREATAPLKIVKSHNARGTNYNQLSNLYSSLDNASIANLKSSCE